jgi:hemerythrin-like domain-containing protein
MSQLLDELRVDHRSIARILDCLERQVQRLAADTHPDFEVIAAAIAYFEGFPDLRHHPKEDVVFAMLQARDKVSAWIVGDIAAAHRALHDKLLSFAALVHDLEIEAEVRRDGLVDAARAFIEAQRRHFEMEERNFFPAAERSLTAADWAEAALAAQPLEALQHDLGGARFAALARDIRAWDAEDRAAEGAVGHDSRPTG